MAKKSTDENEIKQFKDELDTILQKSGVKTTSLKEGGQISYWLDTGSCALNWIICNDFFKGVPGARAILISGECLQADTKITILVDDALAKKILEKIKN